MLIGMTLIGFALGIVIGLVWFFRRRKRKRLMEKEAETDPSSEAPRTGQEEEWTEPPRSASR
jgi:LPXTG-motif cell wall-anchored protein